MRRSPNLNTSGRYLQKKTWNFKECSFLRNPEDLLAISSLPTFSLQQPAQRHWSNSKYTYLDEEPV